MVIGLLLVIPTPCTGPKMLTNPGGSLYRIAAEQQMQVAVVRLYPLVLHTLPIIVVKAEA